MVPAADSDSLCSACRLNRTIPGLLVAGNNLLWQRLQTENNRLIYSTWRLRLALVGKRDSPERGLAFDFLSDPNPRFREDGSFITSHAQGVIPIDVAEADDAIREKVRQQMVEPYRTILGHFRHESGHYYGGRLVRDSSWSATFRERFGDERIDCEQALHQHYAEGPPSDWPLRYAMMVSVAPTSIATGNFSIPHWRNPATYQSVATQHNNLHEFNRSVTCSIIQPTVNKSVGINSRFGSHKAWEVRLQCTQATTMSSVAPPTRIKPVDAF